MNKANQLEKIIEDTCPESYDHNMRRDRPYTGQQWTDHGERGRKEIAGVTFRDLRDCYVRACFLSAGHQHPAGYEQALKGVDAVLCENDVYELDWFSIDPIAVAQNMSCEIEKLMGVFPNLPKRMAGQ